MARAHRALVRAACLAGLASLLQGSTCHAHYCSGDCEEHDEEEKETPTDLLVLPPLRDPLGRPLTGPIRLGRDGDQFR
jgi:hypothetical protein